ncbi:hypothetical protein [Treponema phagedenis]|uniref:hypothetical protein n=1 Tax=Treponema phagedenis TaxID=162 RepID=UPI002091E355|nr:hypothetical protein [Treponema phagedenis]
MKKADYSKSEVEKIIAICFEEMNTSIDRAFDEGYKQGLLAASPDAAYYKRLSKDLEKEVNAYNHGELCRGGLSRFALPEVQLSALVFRI